MLMASPHHLLKESLLLLPLSHFSRVRLLATPWTAAYQAPPPMGFSRQEYWSGVPLPFPKESLNPPKLYITMLVTCFAHGSVSKESACNAGDQGLIPGSGRSPGEGNDNPFQYSSWRIPWTEEPSGLWSVGSQRIRHN